MKPKDVSLIGALICISLSAITQAQTTIRIRFANGRNGKPLRLKTYEYGPSSVGAKGYQIQRVDGDTLVVRFNDVATFQFRSSEFESCDTRTKQEPGPKYDLDEIVRNGQVAPNFCGHTQASPIPGELLIYSRHRSWWKFTGDLAKGLLICG